MVLWYHWLLPARPGRAAERRAGQARGLMNPEPHDVDASVRRVRRGCTFVAVLVAALAVFFTSATGNLFYLTLLIAALFLAIFARFVR